MNAGLVVKYVTRIKSGKTISVCLSIKIQSNIICAKNKSYLEFYYM